MLCLLLVFFCLPVGSVQAAVAGDVNGDGAVSVADYTLLRLHLPGKKTLTGASLGAADMGTATVR